MKLVIVSAMLLVVLGLGVFEAVGWVQRKHPDWTVQGKRCEEVILGASNGKLTNAKCPYPSRLMMVNNTWICSCRDEEHTMKGVGK